MDLREQIKAIMQKKNITAYRLARDLNIDDSQLSKFFNYKRNLSLGKIEDIANYLGCEIKIVEKE